MKNKQFKELQDVHGMDFAHHFEKEFLMEEQAVENHEEKYAKYGKGFREAMGSPLAFWLGGFVDGLLIAYLIHIWIK